MSSAGPALAEDTRYGDPLSDAAPIGLGDLLAAPERYVGKPVKVEGRIREVCPKKGCWIDIASDDRVIRFKVMDGIIEFETEETGRAVIAEGILSRRDLTREQAVARARHLAEERGQPFDPATVDGPVTVYRLEGIGALVTD